ncbi:transcriptional regulator [filamentous cyanobacterium CCP3]|nr:transcriptional regulator [filamentous cyanobacterium CCP3]
MSFHQDYRGVAQPEMGQLIRELRQTLKLTQEQFAAQLGVSFPTINRWENGHANPSRLALKQINTLVHDLSTSPDVALSEQGRSIQRRYFPPKTLSK